MSMRNLKRLLSMTLALALVLSIAGFNYFVKDASADSYDQAKVNSFTDIEGHWAKASLSNLIGYGYMQGIGDNKADPNGTLTTAQLVTLLVRIMGGAEEADLSNYADMDPGAWYYSYMAQGVGMGIVPNTNSNYLNPGQGSSREYAAYMLCRAFGLTVREPIDDYADADRVSDWAVSSMQAMVASKAIVGANGQNNTRNLNPQEIITRAEFSEMIYRLCKNFVKPTDSASIRGGTIDGGVLIAKSGTKLNGVTVKGNVYIADAVGTGSVTLADTKVEGNIYVRGSGEHSVHLDGETTANSVVFLNPYNATRLVVGEDASINGVLINNGVDEVTLEGKVGNVTINVSDVDLTLEEAEADNVIINSANSTVTVDKDSKVNALTVASSSTGSSIVNKGELARLALMANDAKLDLSGKVDYLLVGAVSGLNLKLSDDITLSALDLHCSNSTINIDSEIGTINVSGFSEKLKLVLDEHSKVSAIGISSASTDLSVDKDAVVGSVVIDAPKYKGTISSNLKVLTIGAGATEADVTFAKDANIEVLNVYANKVKVTASAGSSIKDINITGTEGFISGQGAVERVNVAETANKTEVETPNTRVSNAGASDVKAGTIDLPANKSYVTSSSGKDVVRNNDGTPDGDGNKETGAAQEVATVANYTLTYAGNATPQDIDASGKWSLSDLGDGLSLTKNVSGATYRLTGNVKKVESFLPVFDMIAGYGTGYYVPVVLEAESMATDTSYIAEANGVRYTSANLSKGIAYNGKLIIFIQLQPGTTNKITTVTFDRDGAGTAYSPVTVSIDYSGVTFDGAQDLTGELFSYPTNATPQDLTQDAKLALGDFGTLSLANTTGNTYTVLGTASYITTEVKGNVGSVVNDAQGNAVVAHHYVPIMVNTSSFSSGWTVVLDGTTRYTASNVSSGAGCRGHLILLLPLTPANGMTHTIYLDRDGDGRVDADGTYTFNCISVTLAEDSGSLPGEFVDIPDYITVTLDKVNGSVAIHDDAGDLYLMANLEERSNTAAAYIESYLNSQGYTNISHENQGANIILFRGTDETGANVFSWSRTSGITFSGDPSTIPESIQIEFSGDTIIIHDTEDTLSGLSDAVREAIVKKYIYLALTAANYTIDQQTVSGGNVVTYALLKGELSRFTTNLTTDIVTTPMDDVEEIDVSYTIPGKTGKQEARVKQGATVKDLFNMIEGISTMPGSYYQHLNESQSGTFKVNSQYATDKLADGDTINFGYYTVTVNDLSVGDDVTVAIDFGESVTGVSKGVTGYILAGETITVEITITGEDADDDEFKLVVASSAGAIELDEITDEDGCTAFDVEGGTITITVSEELSEKCAGNTFTVKANGDMTFTLTATPGAE